MGTSREPGAGRRGNLVHENESLNLGIKHAVLHHEAIKSKVFSKREKTTHIIGETDGLLL